MIAQRPVARKGVSTRARKRGQASRTEPVPFSCCFFYQNHACFVPVNCQLSQTDAQDIRTLWDIKATDTRELVAADFVHAIRRLSDPRVPCPIFPILANNLLGMKEYQEELQRRLDEVRRQRMEAAGAFYNQEQDERHDPIPIDYAVEVQLARRQPGW